MVRYAVGYSSRAVVSFGSPIRLAEYDPEDRRSMVDLKRYLRDAIGKLYTVLPTALVAAAMRPSITRADLTDRVGQLIDILQLAGARIDVQDAAAAVEAAIEPLATRGIVVMDGRRYRVRERVVLRYYARSIEHLLRDRGQSDLTH